MVTTRRHALRPGAGKSHHPASGTFGYGYEFAELYDINCLGTFSSRARPLHPRQRIGNAQPRIAEAPGGMLNAVGLQNPGVDAVIAEECQPVSCTPSLGAGPTVSGLLPSRNTSRGLSEAGPHAGRSAAGRSHLLQNVHGGGISFAPTRRPPQPRPRAVKRRSPESQIVSSRPTSRASPVIAKACRRFGSRRGQPHQHGAYAHRLRGEKPLLASQTGGMSGPAIFPLAVRMVRRVGAVRIPIIGGIGGVRTAEDVLELMLAERIGQSARSQSGRPALACGLVNDLPRVMEQLSPQNLERYRRKRNHG